MSYYTMIKTVNQNVKAIKTEVSCIGSLKGFTNSITGKISFELSYNVSAK